MNWGYKILAVYLVFVAGIVVMVYKSSTQKIDLVTTDYYAKELKYQERIDAVKRTTALSGKVRYEVKENTILLKQGDHVYVSKILSSIKYGIANRFITDKHEFMKITNKKLIVGIRCNKLGEMATLVKMAIREFQETFDA